MGSALNLKLFVHQCVYCFPEHKNTRCQRNNSLSAVLYHLILLCLKQKEMVDVCKGILKNKLITIKLITDKSKDG